MKCSTGSAIILSITAFKDYDAIITLFTKEIGKITVIAKGIRKHSSKNKGHSRIGSLVEYEVFLGKTNGMGRLKKFITKQSCLSEKIEEQTRLILICEVCNQFLSDHQPEEQIFNLWNELLSVFPLSEQRMKGFLCQFFQREGFFPIFRKKILEPIYWDSEYGIVGESSLSSPQKKISLSLLKVFHFASHSPLSFTEKIEMTTSQHHEWWDVFWWFYSHYCEFLPRSKKVYEQIIL